MAGSLPVPSAQPDRGRRIPDEGFVSENYPSESEGVQTARCPSAERRGSVFTAVVLQPLGRGTNRASRLAGRLRGRNLSGRCLGSLSSRSRLRAVGSRSLSSRSRLDRSRTGRRSQSGRR